MPPTTKDTDRAARALIDLVDLIDYWRPSWRILPGSAYRMSFSLLTSSQILEQYAPNFPKDIISWINEYRNLNLNEPQIIQEKGPWFLFQRKYPIPDWRREKEVQYTIFGLGLIFITVFSWYVLVVILDQTIPNSSEYLFFLIFALISYFLFFAAIAVWTTHNKIQRGRVYNSDLLRLAQRTIDYTREYFKKNDIDPKDSPMKLAFNDYQGLTYERKGRRYLAFVKID